MGKNDPFFKDPPSLKNFSGYDPSYSHIIIIFFENSLTIYEWVFESKYTKNDFSIFSGC